MIQSKPSEKGEIITYLSRMGDVLDHIFQRQHDTTMKISGIRCVKLIRNSNEANIMSMEILFDIITCVNRISP